jgi:malate synthase
VFVHAEKALGVPPGSIKATVLIETILAAFEMDEILYELRDHVVGLNCGRWDYIFSFIKKFRNRYDFVLPDRAQVTMTTHFMRAYALELIRTCHKRGAFAMGGMAAQIPIKNDPAANEAALAQVHADKEREAGDGHDGTWVAHPGLVPLAKEVFDRLMPFPNQLARQRQDVSVTARYLIAVPAGTITEAGVRTNINVGIQYLAAWLSGNGCVPIRNLMEDAATAEISRAQLWQWRRHAKAMEGAIRINDTVLERLFAEEMERIRAQVGEEAWQRGRYAEARDLFWRLTVADEFAEFLTLPAYDVLLRDEDARAAPPPTPDEAAGAGEEPAHAAGPSDAEAHVPEDAPAARKSPAAKRAAKTPKPQRAAASKAVAPARTKSREPGKKTAAATKTKPAAKKPAGKAGRNS